MEGTESSDCINGTTLVLVLKVKNPTLVTQFRPSSLCNVLYMIASEVISNRLKLVLPDIISEEQCAFVPGRLIIDNAFIAFECIHAIKQEKDLNRSTCAYKARPLQGLRHSGLRIPMAIDAKARLRSPLCALDHDVRDLGHI